MRMRRKTGRDRGNAPIDPTRIFHYVGYLEPFRVWATRRQPDNRFARDQTPKTIRYYFDVVSICGRYSHENTPNPPANQVNESTVMALVISNTLNACRSCRESAPLQVAHLNSFKGT